MIDQNIGDFFADLFFRELGIVYSKENYYQLEGRLERVAKELQYASVGELYQAAVAKKVTGNQLSTLLDSATNNETSFFRDPLVFECLKEYIEEQLKAKPDRAIRVWSAASSKGQEPYSVAMLLNEAQKDFPNFEYEVIATDVSDSALEYAKAGRFSELEVSRGLSADLRKVYFEADESRSEGQQDWVISSSIKRKVKFYRQNLKESFSALGSFDLVLCRNVLIYQNIESKKEVVERMAMQMHPKGILILGAAENLMGISEKFEQNFFKQLSYYTRKPDT